MGPSKKDPRTSISEEEEEPSLTAFLQEKLRKFFIDHIPVESVHELPPGYFYSAGMIAYVCAFGIFAYFVSTSYLSAINQAFIAVDQNSGTCETVPVSVTQNFLADSSGNWEGSPDFSYSQAKYSFAFNNFQVETIAQYDQMMDIYYDGLVALGQYGATKNLPYNLLLWMGYIHYYSVASPLETNFSAVGYGQLQYLQMTGSAQQIYALSTQAVTFGGFRGACPLHDRTSFDQSNAILQTELNIGAFLNHSLCSDALPPSQFGYSQNIDGGSLLLTLNVETFMLSMGANLGLVDVGTMTVASDEFLYVHMFNTSYSAAQYYDQRNEQMDPMWCIRNVTPVAHGAPDIQTLCFYSSSSALALPVFEHVGTSFIQPEYCNCSTNGNSKQCNQFMLLSGLIFFPVEDSLGTDTNTLVVSQMTYLMQLMASYRDYYALNEAAFEATWTLGTNVFGRQAAQYTTESWYLNTFNFLQIPSGLNGSMIVFTSVDSISHLVSTYKLSLTNGSCIDSFSIPRANWNILEATSPAQLTQDYYKCYPAQFDAFLNALGIASGNTSLALPIAVLMLMPLLYGFLSLINHVPPKEEYKREEKVEAVNILAMILLRLRDGKTRGIKPKGVLMELTRELVAAAKEDGGYPDSDDEDEDEEGGGEGSGSSGSAAVAGKRLSARIQNHTPMVDPSSAGTAGDSDDEDDECMDIQGDLEGIRPSTGQKCKSRRVGSVNMSVAVPKKKKGRMGVFTKHLDAQLEAEIRHESTRRNSEQAKRQSTTPSAPVSKPAESSGLFGYLFGSEARASSTGVEMDDMATNPIVFLDYNANALPAGINVLNGRDPGAAPPRPVKIDHLENLVGDLVRSLGEAMNAGDLRSAKQSDAYHTACALAQRLAAVDFQAFVGQDNLITFLQLSNALSMHASIELFVEMKHIDSYTDRIAYNVGNKIVTAGGLSTLLV